ncbi:acyltransferase [Marinobacter oulmenensis]|uniref:Acetyltransferase-like isoleucine patch superfamily enzyme n=1 Tax=Marinobacter oulmenensis TaxID=643747 RepID=A0A840UHT3_9GAMM|nr:acyltransferase [Marinobacter oulmenensis]MBB5320706.1 acetyltransferase-like isoleucine patch superfamily enzyme [Marinobacter oulmenensis]
MNSFLKSLFRLFMTLLAAPLIVIYWLLRPVSRADQLFAGFSQLLSLVPGLSGSYLRVAFYRFTMGACSRDLYIGFGTLFSQQPTELGSGCYIGPQCNIGLCTIEKNCLLGSGVHILSGRNQHRFDGSDTPIRLQGGVFTRVTVGENSWIGNGAIVMANIGSRCVVGAGAVVTRDVPPGSVVVGNPARVVDAGGEPR